MFVQKKLITTWFAVALALTGCGDCIDDYGNTVECFDESDDPNQKSCCDDFRFIEDQTACLQGLLDC